MTDDDIEKYMLEMQETFVESCIDQIEEIESLLEKTYKALQQSIQAHDFSDQIKSIRRAAHSIKGKGRSFGFPAVSVISHRLEDYLSNTQNNLSVSNVRDVQIFLDRIRDALLKNSCSLTPELTVAEMVRELPTWNTASNDTKGADLEIMLVMADGLQKKVIDHELAAKGYRVTHVLSGVQAIEMALHTHPDMVLCSYVIDGLMNGVDLAGVLRALSETKHIPFVLLTTYERHSAELRDLPPSVLIARKNEHFAADFTKCLADANIQDKQTQKQSLG